MSTTTPYNTTTATNHGLLIQVAGGAVVGAITSYTTNETLGAKKVFEFGPGTTQGGGDDIAASRGQPYEIVPGNSDGTTIGIERYDLWGQKFEQVFGSRNWDMLTSQDKSISLIEFIESPNGDMNYSTVYFGVWFTTIGRTHSTEGDRIIKVNAQAMYTRKKVLR